MSKLNELRQARAAVVAEMTKINAGEQTAETRAKFAELDAKQEGIASDIRNIEKGEKLSAELGETRTAEIRTENRGSDPLVGASQEVLQKAYRAAYWDKMSEVRSGKVIRLASKRSEEILARCSFGAIETRTDDQAAGQWGNVTGLSYTGGDLSGGTTSGIAGGYTVPPGFVYDVDVATKYFAPLMSDGNVRVMDTATGAVLPWPTANDTSNQAAVLADSTQETEQGVPFGVVNFGAYKYSSKIVRISLELLQDSAFNLEDFLKQQFAIRFGRGYEAAFTTGSGVAQPKGIVTAVLASGATPVVGAGSNSNDGLSQNAALTIGSNDLISLEHSVDPTYRRGAKFMLHDKTLKVIKQLLDKYGRPLWVPGLASNAPDTILGYPYVINQAMATPVANTNPTTVLFGDLQKFVIRKVKDMQVLKLVERYADFGQVGFIAFSRVDSNLVDAGTHPINALQQHS